MGKGEWGWVKGRGGGRSGMRGGREKRMFFFIATITMSRYGQKYAGGLVRSASGQVYVSRGIGVVGLPVRFNCPPEITIITLTKAV